MAFNISDFRAKMADGLARPTLFEVRVFPPPRVTALNPQATENLSFKINRSEIPSRLLTSIEYRSLGPIQKIAQSSAYTDTNLELTLSGRYYERGVFFDWQNLIVNDATTDATQHLVEFYDQYIGSVDIIAYRETGERAQVCTLQEAYPINVSNIQLGWDMNDQVAQFQVDFAFRKFTLSPR